MEPPSCQVKLRLIWRSSESTPTQSQPNKHCYNETLTEDSSFESWKQRVESKFQADNVVLAFRFCPEAVESMPLESDSDFQQLKRHYRTALKAHTKASTFRVLVEVSSVRPAVRPCSSVSRSPVQARPDTVPVSAPRKQLDTTAQLANAPMLLPRMQPQPSSSPHQPLVQHAGCSGQQSQQWTQESSCMLLPACKTPDGKKLRLRRPAGTPASPAKRLREHADALLLSPVKPLQTDIRWDHILRSIVKTIDRHHFGSKLTTVAGSAP